MSAREGGSGVLGALLAAAMMAGGGLDAVLPRRGRKKPTAFDGLPETPLGPPTYDVQAFHDEQRRSGKERRKAAKKRKK